MTVFKTFLKVLNKFKGTVILYTVILVGISAFNMQNSNNNVDFTETKPNILIINKDKSNIITDSLVKYLSDNCDLNSQLPGDIEENDNAIKDALFYRDISYIIYIPENYGKDFMNGLNPEIEIKQTGDYESTLAEMILSNYINTSNSYREIYTTDTDIASHTLGTLNNEVNVSMTSVINTSDMNRAVFYFNFLNYSILAGCVYVICLVLCSFRSEQIKKRTIISSMNYKKYNRILLLSNSLFAVVLWIFYMILGYLLVGDILLTNHGLLLILNSFIFNICAITLAFLVANLLNNKNAINGIINVVALGTSFLCGAFVPAMYLPSSVLTLSHIFPSYYYINSNDYIKTIELFNYDAIKPIIINSIAIILFSIAFIILANIISKHKRKIG